MKNVLVWLVAGAAVFGGGSFFILSDTKHTDPVPVKKEKRNIVLSEEAVPAKGTNYPEISIYAQLAQIQNGTGTMKAAQCAACNQMPAGGGREQCLEALRC